MGAVKRCIHPRAKLPYLVEETGIRLYSIEELAYYLYHNIYLVDEHLIGEKLYQWMEEALGLPRLAEKLRSGRSTGSHVYNQVITILKASEYYSEKEINDFSEKIKMISGMQTQERMKYRADEFLQNENYWAAIHEYEHLLSIRQNTRLEVSFYGDVWNNLGCCYARLFLFRKAAGCFENAYQYQKVPEYQRKAYDARRLAALTSEDSEERLEERIPEELLKESEEAFDRLQKKDGKELSGSDLKDYIKKQEMLYQKISFN